MAANSLVQLLDDWKGTVPEGGAWLEQKHDGWRAFYAPDYLGKPCLWTRNGHPIEGVGHILHRLARMEREAGQPMFFDGELIVGGTLEATKAWCESGWKKGGEAGTFHAFDAIPLREWKAGGGAIPLISRKNALEALVAATDEPEWEWRAGSRGRDEAGPAAVSFVGGQWIFDQRDVIDAARGIWAAGGEGVVIKEGDAPYRRNRNRTWQKVKRENQYKWRNAA